MFSTNSRLMLSTGAGLAAIAVAMGAFGAHALESTIATGAPDEQARLLGIWETAARYHIYHALALCLVGLISRDRPNWRLTAAAWCFLVGTLVFSGCLYALVLSGVKILGAIVPIGGVSLIVGWVLLAWGGWKTRDAGSASA